LPQVIIHAKTSNNNLLDLYIDKMDKFDVIDPLAATLIKNIAIIPMVTAITISRAQTI
jgi:hypothetical protein